jgi:putative ABC transport system permease protein
VHVLGIVIAALITMRVGALVRSLPSKVPPWALITGFSASMAVGVLFGVWPAEMASRLDRVDALRYE